MALIGKIRQHSVLTVLLIGLSMFAFVLLDNFSNSPIFSNQQTLEIVGVIDGEEIDRTTFDRLVNDKKEQYGQQNIGTNLDPFIRNQVWDELVSAQIMGKSYNRLGLTVTSDELTESVRGSNIHPIVSNIPQFKNPETGLFDKAQVLYFLKNLDAEIQDVEPGTLKKQWINIESQIEKDRLNTKYGKMVSQAMYTPKWIGKHQYKGLSKIADAEYIYIPFSKVPDSLVDVSDRDLKNYINKNQDAYKQDALRKINYVYYDIKPSTQDSFLVEQKIIKAIQDFKQSDNDTVFTNLNSDKPFDFKYYTKKDLEGHPKFDELFSVSEGSIVGPYLYQNAYNASKVSRRKKIADSVKISHIFFSSANVRSEEEAQEKSALIDSLYTLLNSEKASFSNIAKTFSEDPATANIGGNLGWIKLDDIQKGMPVRADMFYNDDMSKIYAIQSNGGNFHLVKVTKYTPNTLAVQISNIVKSINISNATSKAIFAEARQFVGKNKTNEAVKNKIEQQQISHSGKAEVRKGDHTLSGLKGDAREAVKWIYKNSKDAVSSVFNIGDKYVVISIDDIQEKGLQPLSQVKETVRKKYLEKQKADRLEKEIRKLPGMDAVKEKYQETPRVAQNISFDKTYIDGVGYEPKVVATVIGLKEGEVSKPIVGNKGVFVLKTMNENTLSDIDDYSPYSKKYASALNTKTNWFESLKSMVNIENHKDDVY